MDPIAHHVAQLRRVLDHADEFDVIHNHMDYFGFPLTTMTRTPVVTTLHGRLDLPDLPAVFAAYPGIGSISISRSQRRPLPGIEWLGTVYHGLPTDLFPAGDGRGGYLAFLGRISVEKRVDAAIRIADATGLPLKIAAKVDPHDQDYFATEIEPMLRHPLVEFIGEIGEREKADFLGRASALLFPIDWPEPFGLVVIEALACGTPVIARARGSVPELLDHGRTGFICANEEEMIAAVASVPRIDRAVCRATFEARFTAARMADDYLAIYRAEIASRESARRPMRRPTAPGAMPTAASATASNGHASPAAPSGTAAASAR
jgi:glycosyltransferase involved in cell wall biosynthesis